MRRWTSNTPNGESASTGLREKLFARFQKLDKRLQGDFPKFFYKKKILEDMIPVAGNVHQKFQSCGASRN